MAWRDYAVLSHVSAMDPAVVATDDPDIDPLAVCIGDRGTRVRAVAEALGEAVAVTRWMPPPSLPFGWNTRPAIGPDLR